MPQGFSGKIIHGTTQSKQGDGGWAPKRPPHGHSKKWPAVVLEVAVSENYSKLFSDARFWLYESQGDVKIVLALAVNRESPEVTIEKWELRDNRIHCSQNVNISKSQAGSIITVCGDPLAIVRKAPASRFGEPGGYYLVCPGFLGVIYLLL